MGNICKQYKELSNVLLKPNRMTYDPEFDLFQSGSEVKGVPVERRDFGLTNDDGHKLACHLFFPEALDRAPIDLVCFLHTRGGNALEGKFLLNAMLPNVAVLLFNFAGSGLSEGEYVSLGMNETRDFKLVLDEAKRAIPVGRVCLWGRSMGAVTALMFTKLWNNPQRFFVSKDEYISKNKGEYERYRKKKEKEQQEKIKADMEGDLDEDAKIEEKNVEDVELEDKSEDADMERDLLMSKSGGTRSKSNGKSFRSDTRSTTSKRTKISKFTFEEVEEEVQQVLTEYGRRNQGWSRFSTRRRRKKRTRWTWRTRRTRPTPSLQRSWST